jgi:hypothetical protein
LPITTSAPPPPEWKSRDYLKDVLSKYDPHRKDEA